MIFKEFPVTVQESIDLLASFFDDLSSIHALQIMTIEENNICLIAQRDNIRGCMISVDRFKRRLNSKKMKQNDTIQKRIQNAKLEKSELEEVVKFDFSSNHKDGDNALNTLDTMDSGY